jgi:hypothetical protein
METLTQIIPWVKLLIELGMAVYEAAESGEGDKTVDEILEGRSLDMDKLRALDAEALEHFRS